jgi:hypothetical protein
MSLRLGIVALVGLVLCSAAAPATATPARAPAGGVRPYPTLAQGDFIFYPLQVHTDPVAKQAYFDYVKRFRVLLTNGYDVFSGDDLAQLKQGGSQLFVYRWFEGYYVQEAQFGHPAVKPMYDEVGKHPDWLINPNAPTAGNGATLPAYFFDWANPDLRAFYIDFLLSTLNANGYDGVFFDYLGDWGLPAQISDMWQLKHPEITYNEAGGLFLAELRKAMGSRPIFGNAGYKADKADVNAHFYDSLTYDTTESYGTSFTGKSAVIYLEGKGPTQVTESYYRPWDGVAGYKDDMEGATFGPIPQQNGVVTFLPIDYVQPAYQPTGEYAMVDGSPVPVYREAPDRAAIFYSYALAKLHNMSSFASDWASWNGDPSSFRPQDVYLADLGQPLEAGYRELPDAVVRYFQNGFVVVTRTNSYNAAPAATPVATGSADPVRFTPDPAMVPAGVTGLWNLYTNSAVAKWAPGRKSAVTIKPVLYPATGSYYPSGRVYMYTR